MSTRASLLLAGLAMSSTGPGAGSGSGAAPPPLQLHFATCDGADVRQRFTVVAPNGTGEIHSSGAHLVGRCLMIANCSSPTTAPSTPSSAPAVVLDDCATGACAGANGGGRWTAVAAPAGSTMFTLARGAGIADTVCATLNAPNSGPPLAWAAATCDATAANNDWHVNYRDGSMMRVHSLACVDPTNCCLAVTPPPPPPPAPCFTSAAAGSSRIAAISVGDNSTAAERFAATELAEHLGNISGVRIPVLRPAQAAKAGNHIAVGYFASLQAGLAASRLEGLGDENFTIASGSPSPRPGSGVRPGLIALSGGYESLRGTQYAVYTFLEWVGVRWWAPDETFFPPCPSSDRFIWAAEEQWYADQGSSTPGAKPVAVRDPGTWTASTHPLWSLRMRLNVGGYDRSKVSKLDNTGPFWANASLGRGGVITYTELPGGGGGASVFNLVDTWPLVDNCTMAPMPTSYGGCYTRACGKAGGNPSLCPPLELCEQHKDWFWPPDCSASGGQLCWSAPGLADYLINRSLTLLRATSFHKPGDRAALKAAGVIETYFSISQMDGTVYCQSPGELAAIAADGGAPSGPMIATINKVADAIAHEFPDILIDTQAYEATQKAPNTTIPRPTVQVKVIPINANFGAPLVDSSNLPFLTDMQAWSKISTRLSLWSYPICYGYAGQFKPWPSWFVTAQNIQYAAANNVSWIYLESTVAAVGVGGLAFEMEPLRAYLTAAMMWKPAQDWAKLADAFLEGYYGAEGAFGVRTYLDTMGGAEAASHFYLGQYNPVYDDPSKPDFLKADYLTPTSTLTSAQGLTAARRSVAKGTSIDPGRQAVLLMRIDAAKMPIYLVTMYRWHELAKYTAQAGLPWPLEETTLEAAYQEWTRVFTTLKMSFGLGVEGSCCVRGSFFFKLIFNRTTATTRGVRQLTV